MDPEAFRILERKRRNRPLDETEIRTVVTAAASGAWGDAELAAFLMAAAIHGLDGDETRLLTRTMLESGEQWDLAADIPALGDKHSTGGVGDKVSLILSPLLAACGRPVVMLTGRGLGHTGGTADKLESIPGLDLALDRDRCLRVLAETEMAIGMATGSIAPADRRLYALRDRTATIDSLQLITASILSKKLATGAAGLVFDVKTGNGAFLPAQQDAEALARLLVETAAGLGRKARALVTDMSQPLGCWVGHTAEVRETLDCLAGEGPEDLMDVTYALSEEVADLVGAPLTRQELEAAIASGAARQRFDRWAEAQGADSAWLARPTLTLAPEEVVITAPRAGVLAAVATKHLGEHLTAAGGGRLRPDEPIDFGIALRVECKLGESVATGQPLARLYLRRRDEKLIRDFEACFEIADTGTAPPYVYGRI